MAAWIHASPRGLLRALAGSALGVPLALAAGPGLAGPRVVAVVVHVTDGDTLWAEVPDAAPGLQSREKVRLAGIDCPEQAQEPWGRRATQRLKQLVQDRRVHIEIASRSRDRYGRLLAYVHLGPQLVQETLVREGFCFSYPHPPNVEYLDRIRAAQSTARAERRGVHDPGRALAETPAEFRRKAPD